MKMKILTKQQQIEYVNLLIAVSQDLFINIGNETANKMTLEEFGKILLKKYPKLLDMRINKKSK